MALSGGRAFVHPSCQPSVGSNAYPMSGLSGFARSTPFCLQWGAWRGAGTSSDMAGFLIIDPKPWRRWGLRIFLQPPNEVVECSSFRESVTACARRAFKAAFIVWPEGVAPDFGDSPTWSCEHLVLIVSDTAQAPRGNEWAQRHFSKVPITLMRYPGGNYTFPEISRAVSRVLETPAVSVPEMVGSSPALRELMELAVQLAATDCPVLITGEPGTGKEALARWIRARSERARRPLETFDCAGLDPAAAFSALFGHEKGAFPWATQAHPGLLAEANGGTLYIREVCDLDRALQTHLCNFLVRPASGVKRLGGQEPRQVDVRIIAASSRSLSDRLGEEFSRDLYHCFRPNYLKTLPLRERPSDIPELIRHFLSRLQGTVAGGWKWEPRALLALQSYQWPGNLDELEEVVAEAALKTALGREVKFEHLPVRIRNAAQQAGLDVGPPQDGGTPDSPVPVPTISITAPPGPSESNGPPVSRTEAGLSFPTVEFTYGGYRMLRELATTSFSRVLLAERETGRLFRIVKFSEPRNQEQCEAVETIMNLADTLPEAKKYMIPIEHACNCPLGPWYMVVLPCLDDCNNGRNVNVRLYQPHTFHEWIARVWRDRIPKPPDEVGELEVSVLDRLMEILRVLDFFHNRGLLMIDVKPSNFGFYEGRLVAIDYGGFTRNGEPADERTPDYFPKKGPDEPCEPADDIYAVVKMMAEALYEKKPNELNPDTVEGLAKDYRDGKLIFDALFWKIIEMGMGKTPDLRFRHAWSMINLLEEMKQKLLEYMKGRDGRGRAK